MTKFGVVIVTYNRLQLLKECLTCVDNQTLSPVKVIIINNHSTDGTEEYLEKRCSNDSYVVINENENLGGAGGYYEGLKEIVNYDIDYAVLIDDDAMLSGNYLSEINKAISSFPNVRVFSGSVITDANIIDEHRRRLIGVKDIPVPLDEYNKKYFRYDLSSFCGVVISKQLVKKVGLPEKAFFIWFDDTEYSMRLREYTPFINVCDCYVNHKTKLPDKDEEKSLRKNNWKEYYGLRNKIYSFRKHNMNKAAVYWAFLYIRRPAFNRLLFLWPKEKKQINDYNYKMLRQAISDGFSGNLGKNSQYLPE